VRSWVGSGVPHNIDVSELAPGAIVEVEAMGLTPDGKLREPRFKGIRYDKAGAD
jgi:ATP-dependent DNA ligase